MSRRGNNEGSIYKRSDGRWAAIITIASAGAKPSRRFLYGKTRAEVAGKLAAALRDQQVGLPLPSERLTVSQFLGDWLEGTIRPTRRPTTYAGYEVNVRVHIVPAIGRVRLSRLTPAHVRRLLNESLAEGLAPRTVQYIHAVLKASLKQAVADGLIHRNVATLVQGPAVPTREVRPLSPDQVRAFLDGVRDDRLEALYFVAFTLGLRQSEILGLAWERVDLDAGTLEVTRGLARGRGVRYQQPKSERSRRTLVLPSITSDALRRHRVRQFEERVMVGAEWGDHGLVFTNPFGKPIDHRNATRVFQRHLARLGLPRQRFHDARHACATFLLSKGVALRVVQEILGHSQISLTANTYAHVMPALQREAVAEIDAAFARG